jgi:hypothetical protein
MKKKYNNNNNNICIYFIPNCNKIKNLLIHKGIINNNENNENPLIEAKIITKDDKYINIGFGIYSYNSPNYKETHSKITWTSTPFNHLPQNEYENIKSPHQIIKFDNSIINKDFIIKKRNLIYPSINDDILIKINPNYFHNNIYNPPLYIKYIIENIKEISSNEGLKCKVLTYNLWDPPSKIENITDDNITKGFTTNIPGSIILGTGKWNKYKIPYNKQSNKYDFLSHNLFPISDLTKQNFDNSFIFFINNKDLFYFNFYILK